MNRHLLPITAVLALAAASFGGCGSTPPATFYVLEAQPAASGSAEATDLALGVGPCKLANYLDRPQLVRRSAGSELKIEEYHRWAESLDDSVPRILAANLSGLLRTDRVVLFPWKAYRPLDRRVEVIIEQFEPGPGGAVVLAGRWMLVNDQDPEGTEILRFRVEVPASEGDAEAQASAMSEALARLAKQIAAAVQADLPTRTVGPGEGE